MFKGVDFLAADNSGRGWHLGLLEIVFGIVYGAIFFRERPGLLPLLGMTAIVMAAAVPYLQHYNGQKGTIDD